MMKRSNDACHNNQMFGKCKFKLQNYKDYCNLMTFIKIIFRNFAPGNMLGAMARGRHSQTYHDLQIRLPDHRRWHRGHELCPESGQGEERKSVHHLQDHPR
jgi:hypothetical protein